MYLNRVELEQVCQHEHVVWDLQPGLIICQGPNGSGKSNAWNVAVYGALTNNYRRHAEGKKGLARKGCPADASSKVALTFSQEGSQYRLERGFKSPEYHLLQLPSGDQLHKDSEIQGVLEDALGLTRRLIDDYVFVHQEGLYSFLDATEAVRSKAFAHLCGTTDLENVWTALGDSVARDSGSQILPDDRREILGKELETSMQELAQLELEIIARESDILSDEEQWSLEEERRLHCSRKYIEENLLVRRQLITRYEPAAKEKFSAWKTKTAELENYEQTSDELTAQLKEIEKQEKEAIRIASSRKLVSDLRDEIRREEYFLEGMSAPVPPESSLGTVNLEASFVNVALDNARKMGEVVASGRSTCPTCGSSVSAASETVSQLLASIPSLETKQRELNGQIYKHQQYAREEDKYKFGKALREERLEKLRLQLFEAEAEVESAPYDALASGRLAEEKQLVESQLAKIRSNESDIRVARAEFETAKAQHKLTAAEISKFEEQLAGLAVPRRSTEELELCLSQHKAASAALTSLRSSLAGLHRRITCLQQDLQKQQDIFQKAERFKPWLQTVGDVRDLFHRDNFPRKIHLSYLQQTEEGTNQLLETFGAPFTVRASEDLSFTVRFSGGLEFPASALSGGQRVMLALAFRLTISSIFASRTGIMILDEPTDGLDRDNQKSAIELFRCVGEMARAKGTQLIVITHDESLAAVGDQCLQLGKPTLV